MSPKKAFESPKDTSECILRLGRNNNIITWREETQTAVTLLYGMTGTFLTTNQRYVIPIPREADYIPIIPDVEEGEAPHAPLTQALQAKLREGAFEGRRKAVEKQKSDERMIWPLMWKLMSAASQSKVREDPDFEDAFLHLDCIRLWDFIRRSHLTHIFGNGDPMREVNIGEQESRYAALRQGEKEYLSTFKTRFDSQIQAGEGAGVAVVTESKRAIEFISKLDPRRYGNMSSKMRNDALRNVPDAYPTTLAAAYRVASGWINEHGTTTPATSEIAQESAFVTADADPGIDTKHQNRKKKGNNASSVTCFVCGIIGHYARDCSKRLGKDKVLITRGQPQVDDDDEQGVYVCQREHEKAMFTRFDILLDTEASLNVFCNRDLLTNVTPATHHVVMTGVDSNAKGVKVVEQGQFEKVGIVYYSAQATANILSFASQIDEGATIDYNKSTDVFTLQPAHDNRLYTFARKQKPGSEGRLYSCDTRSMVAQVETANIATIEENLSQFSKRDIASAMKARQLLARMSFPSVEDAKLTVRHGTNFTVSPADFDNADTIWGPDTATLKGKSTKKPSPIATLTVLPAKQNPPQILSVDILFLDRLPVLIGIAHPLDLTLATPLTGLDPDIPSRSAAAVKIAVDTLLNTLTSKSYTTSVIMTDGEGAIGKLIPYLNELGIEVDVSAAGGHVARVERRIRVIKERVRAHMAHHLPYGLSTLCLTMLILYCVSRLNFMPSGTRADNYSPREVFLGRTSDAHRDFRCGYGDYVQSTTPDPTNNMQARTEDCIVLLPTGNRSGSVKLLNLSTGRVITRNHFVIMPIPASAIQRLNTMALNDGRSLPNVSFPAINSMRSRKVSFADASGGLHVGGQVADGDSDPAGDGRGVDEQPRDWGDTDGDSRGVNEDLRDRGDTASNTLDHADAIWGDITNENYTPDGDTVAADRDGDNDKRGDTVAADRRGDTDDQSEIEGDQGDIDPDGTTGAADNRGDIDSDGTTGAADNRGADEIDATALDVKGQHARGKIRRTLTEQAMTISVRDALRTRGEAGKEVIMKELQQMLTKGVWTPVLERNLTSREQQGIIRSSMFVKEKYLANGEYDKLKARLVAGGHMQDKSLYDDLSAPTASASGVFTVLAIAAKEERLTAVIDIGGAFLHASMNTEIPVYMRLDATLTSMLVELSEEYREFTDKRGRVVVHLRKALYGCVESAALWYEHLAGTLRTLGYTANAYDACVFNRTNSAGEQCTIALHVDDLYITSKTITMIDELEKGLREAYGEVKCERGEVLNYLGMVFDTSVKGEARVTMKGFVEDILRLYNGTGVAKSPATDELFKSREGACQAAEEQRQNFHSWVAKLLYLAKRARPDVLTAVAYLATKVQKCDTDDLDKLDRVMRYLRGTRDRGIVLRPGVGDELRVSVYIDAAYGVHSNGKSHTGSCVVVGELGVVHCKSEKQKIVTKSSTEAELVALSDSCNQALHVRKFLEGQGYDMGPVRVYQDNLSCMALVARGRSGAEKTRHIDIRYFWVKERVDKGEATIEHKGTEEMYANLLTKPLQGGQFEREREMLTGWQ